MKILNYHAIKIKLGFTLIEMLVTVAIAAALLGALVPVLSTYLPSIQLSGSTRTLTGNLREIQELSLTEQDQYLIRFTQLANPPTYQLIKVHNSVESKIQDVQLSSNISLSLDPSATQIVFSPDGGPSVATTLTLTLNSSQKKVDISPAGFIKIE